jgi:hypothetical protein
MHNTFTIAWYIRFFECNSFLGCFKRASVAYAFCIQVYNIAVANTSLYKICKLCFPTSIKLSEPASANTATIYSWALTQLHCIKPYLLTPLNRVLLQKLTGLQLVKKFPAFYGTQRFNTAFTSGHHYYPNPARSSPYPHIPLPEDTISNHTDNNLKP